MKLTREDILHLAELSRLDVSETEIQDAEKNLGKILNYVERLSQVPTENVEPYTSPLRSEFRADIAIPAEDIVRESIIKNFPAKQGSLLKTPGVFSNPKH